MSEENLAKMKLNEMEKDRYNSWRYAKHARLCRLRIKGRIFDSMDNSQQRGPCFLRPGSGLRVN